MKSGKIRCFQFAGDRKNVSSQRLNQEEKFKANSSEVNKGGKGRGKSPTYHRVRLSKVGLEKRFFSRELRS